MISTPRRAAAVMALITVTGALITSAQGQAITSSASARYSQPVSPGRLKNGCPKSSGGTTATNAAITTINGVYTCAKRSMKRWVGARTLCACSIMRMMRWMVVSCTSRVTSTISAPLPLTVPANTSSPGSFSTGTLSPVIGAWLTALCPVSIFPSIGMRSPAFMRIRSPRRSISTGIVSSLPALIRTACAGARSFSSSSTRRARSAVKPSSASAMAKRKIRVAASAVSPITTAPIPAMVISRLMLKSRLIHKLESPLRTIG